MHPVHTVALDLEDPLVLHTPVIRGHKTLARHAPYLLFIHIRKFFMNFLLHLVQEFALGWFQALVKVFGFSGTGLVLLVTIARLMRKCHFFLVFLYWQFCWHHHYTKLGAFHCQSHFCIDSGFGGCFDLVIGVFVKKVIIVVFNVVLAWITVGITNYVYIIL